MLKYCTLLIVLLTAYSAKGQTPQNDYIIRTKGDTLRGTITLSQDPTATGIGFTAVAGTTSKQYYPADVKGFGMADGRRFTSRKVALLPLASGITPDSVQVFLQQLVTGAARLYVLQHKLVNEPTPTALTYIRYTDQFYLVETDASKRLFLLPENNRRSVLSQILADCPAAVTAAQQDVSEEAHLMAAVQAYSSCYQISSTLLTTRATSAAKGAFQKNWYALVGLNRGKAHYDGNPGLTKSIQKPGLGLLVEVGTDIRRATSVIGTEVGLRYAQRTSGSNERQYTVPAFYANTGATLPMQTQVELHQLQLLLGLKAVQRTKLGLFATLGVAPGVVFRNATRYDNLVTTFVPGTFLPTIIAQSSSIDEKMRLTGDLYAGVGIQPQLTPNGTRLLARIQYGIGRSLTRKEPGLLSYNSLNLQVGIRW